MQLWDQDRLKNREEPRVVVYTGLVSELYDHSWYGKLNAEEIDFYEKWIGNYPTLEMGSGTGRIALPLMKRGCNIYGLEGALAMIKLLWAKLPNEHQERFIHWDAMSTPYPALDGAFDRILVPFSAFGIIHNHYPNVGSNHLFNEFNRLLSMGGILIINDYRCEAFDRTQIETPPPVEIYLHNHPTLGEIREEQSNRFYLKPNRLFPQQIMRARNTRFFRTDLGTLLEEHEEQVPVWDALDFPVMGNAAGFQYEEKIYTPNFHEEPSVMHVFQKISSI